MFTWLHVTAPCSVIRTYVPYPPMAHGPGKCTLAVKLPALARQVRRRRSAINGPLLPPLCLGYVYGCTGDGGRRMMPTTISTTDGHRGVSV